MKTHNSLSLDFLSSKPGAAARVLQTMASEQAAPYLATVPVRILSPILQTMEPWPAARILDHLPAEQNAAVFALLPYQTVAALLRLQEKQRRQSLLGMLPGAQARALRRSLAHQEGTVGAWMDMSTPAFRPELSATECLALLRQTGQTCGGDLMIVDDQHRIRGILPLERLLARGDGRPLSALMDSQPVSLAAEMSLAMAARSPAWHRHTTLPVRTGNGNFLGTLDSETLHQALSRNKTPQPPSGRNSLTVVLGQAVTATLAGLLQVLASDPGTPRRENDRD